LAWRLNLSRPHGHAQLRLGYRPGPKRSGVASGAHGLTGAARSTGGRQDALDCAPPLHVRVAVPALMQVLGALITLWSIWFYNRTMRENSFAAPVIKLQQERGQRVIQSDLTPSSATQCTSAPLSTSLSPHCCSAHGGASSSLSPDRPPLNPHPHRGKVLRAGLVGYDEYAAHVRYRLIPHVW